MKDTNDARGRVTPIKNKRVSTSSTKEGRRSEVEKPAKILHSDFLDRDANRAVLGISTSPAPPTPKIIEPISQSEQRLATILQATGEGYWDWNIESGEVFYSPGWSVSVGYSPDAFSNDASF